MAEQNKGVGGRFYKVAGKRLTESEYQAYLAKQADKAKKSKTTQSSEVKADE